MQLLELLVDADSAIYKAGCANEERFYLIYNTEGEIVQQVQYAKEADEWIKNQAEVDFLDGVESFYTKEMSKTAGPLSHTLANVKAVCNKMTALHHTDLQMFIGGEGNFRYDIYPEYKGKRSPMSRPIHEEEIRNYLIKHWGAQVVDEEEVDDRVSYMQCLSEPKSTCIVSIDKDLLNTPGYNYNYDKEKLVFITPEEANLNFARQLLTGDSTDNIPGLKGVGKIGAMKVLPSYRDDWLDVVKAEYLRVWGDGWEKQINLNGSLLWMRRKPYEVWTHTYWED